jgi:hypothetical protein
MDLILENILNWCIKKSIPIAKGITLDKPRENAFLLEFEDYQDFLNFCNSLSGCVLIYGQTFFDLEESVKEMLELENEDVADLIYTTFQEFKQYDSHPSHLYLSCNYNGFTYLYVEAEDWYLEFEEEVEKQNKIALSIVEVAKKPNLEPAKLDKIINKIASSTEFYAAHTRPNKLTMLVNQMVMEENVNEFEINLFYIEKRALKLFQTNYLSQREQDCREQIAILKKEGKTKKAIISILKITEGMYDSLVGG